MVDDQYSARHDGSGHLSEASSPASLLDALSRLAACADELAAGNPDRPDRDVVHHCLDVLEFAIRHCLTRPQLGCWLDVLCPLKENLWPLGEYADSADATARIDPALVTQTVTLTRLSLALAQQPARADVCEDLLDSMAASVWSWPLPSSARPAFRFAFNHADPISETRTPSRVA
jgi:hypothetical protein